MEQPTKVMNKEQIIDEVYENYEKWWEPYVVPVDYDRDGIPYYSKKEFIDKCKTDPEFSENWGLKIEERELSLDERNEIRDMQYFKNNLHQALKGSDTKIDWENIPIKAITITYNNETIESYE